MTEDQRRDPRCACRLPAVLRRGTRSLDIVSENVSFGGLFLRVPAPPAVRELVEIELQHPTDARPLRVHGMVVHSIRRGQDGDGAPGIGVDLRGLSGGTKASWDSFVRHAQARGEGAPEGGSAEGPSARGAPTVSVGEEEVSEDAVDLWESEEPTHVQHPTAPKKRRS